MALRLHAEHRPGATGRPVVLLLTGVFAGGWIWNAQVAALAAAGWPVLRVTEPVCALGRRAGALRELTDDALALARSHGYHRMVACGASYGGTIALDLAHRYPDSVAAVVAAGVPGFGDAFDTGLSQNHRLDLELLREWVIRACFHDATTISTAHLADLAGALGQSPVGALRASRAIAGHDVHASAAAVSAPVWYVWGAGDRIAPVGPWCERVRGYPTTAGFEVIPACGHLPSAEQPARFTALLTRFLAQLDAGRAHPTAGRAHPTADRTQPTSDRTQPTATARAEAVSRI